MIIGYVGPRGHGKTLLMTARLFRRFNKGYRILTNYKVAFKHEQLDAAKLVEMGEDLHHCAIGADEFHILLDSRNSMSKRNKMITYFILQTRKRHVVLMFTTQDEGQVDVRLRKNVDYWVYCKRLTKIVNGKKIKTHFFLYTVFDGLTGRKLDERLVNGKKFFGLYDTEEVITDWVKE